MFKGVLILYSVNIHIHIGSEHYQFGQNTYGVGVKIIVHRSKHVAKKQQSTVNYVICKGLYVNIGCVIWCNYTPLYSHVFERDRLLKFTTVSYCLPFHNCFQPPVPALGLVGFYFNLHVFRISLTMHKG
jgi:hypothetical protein